MKFFGTIGGLTLLLVLLGTGCATRRVDWSQRVGAYTFDQAISELGPPDKQAKLSNDSVVAEWLMRRGYSYHYPVYSYYPGSSYGPAYPAYGQSYAPDYFLRLTFGPEGKLTAWKNFSK